MRQLTLVLALAVAAVATGACSQTPTSPEFTVPLSVSAVKTGDVTSVKPGDPLSSTHLGGENEVPARPTDAQGQAIMKVAEDGQSISFKLIASNIDNIVASHIHVGAAGSNGPIVVFLFGNAPAELRHYTRFIVESDSALRHRTYPATPVTRVPLVTRDIQKMFDGLHRHPKAGKIGLAVSGPARGRVHVDFAIGSPRHVLPRIRIPLRVERRGRHHDDEGGRQEERFHAGILASGRRARLATGTPRTLGHAREGVRVHAYSV